MKHLFLIKILYPHLYNRFSQNLSKFHNTPSEGFKMIWNGQRIESKITDQEIQFLKNKIQYYKIGSFTEAKSDSEHHFCDLKQRWTK